jgi:ketosteroid isomerase-like protein
MGTKGTPTEIPTDFQQALDRVTAATIEMGHGNPEPYMALWSRADDASLFGAWGPCKQGWDDLSRTLRWVGNRFKGGELRAEVEVAGVLGDLAFTVGYEKGNMVVDGGEPKPLTIRLTHIYRRESGQWKVIHRHGDFAPIDESSGKV